MAANIKIKTNYYTECVVYNFQVNFKRNTVIKLIGIVWVHGTNDMFQYRFKNTFFIRKI